MAQTFDGRRWHYVSLPINLVDPRITDAELNENGTIMLRGIAADRKRWFALLTEGEVVETAVALDTPPHSLRWRLLGWSAPWFISRRHEHIHFTRGAGDEIVVPFRVIQLLLSGNWRTLIGKENP